MEIEIRLGNEKDIDVLENLYNDLNDYLEATTNFTGWRKGIYPIRQDAIEGVSDSSLFVATQNDTIVGSMILRNHQDSPYSTVTWQAELEDSQVLVIHSFVVSPLYLQHGIGKHMLDYAYDYASITKILALRLDVYEKNYPAIKLYEKCGYFYIGSVSLGLEDIGLNWFKLYEKLI